MGEAADNQQALAKVRTLAPDLVLTDLRHPLDIRASRGADRLAVANGPALVRQLRQESP